MIKTCVIAAAAMFAAWFWRRPAGAERTWPDAVPVFACGGEIAAAYELADGGAFLCVRAAPRANEALEGVRAAYLADGWTESPIRASDTLFFTRGAAVAAVLAQELPSGCRITAIQRRRGLK